MIKNQWLNKQQVQSAGIACFIPRQIQVDGEWVWDGRWIGAPEPIADILLSFARCKQLGCPVQPGESPDAYVYKASEKTQFRYVPFWSRFEEQIDMSKTDEAEARIIKRHRGDGVRNKLKGCSKWNKQ
ncbi:hypothetical protein [Paenibacillus algicola]|uniref:hypothetical protein n=1 Tax=Paenibacillus algicola TaxID=2565926 RepID=UPI0010FE3085|nr:hypothetical protein [Paenibacillus algicola]